MARIKVKPEDFIVHEIIDIPYVEKGSYTILKLEKKYWNTLDVIDFVARKTKKSKSLFERAGLKDRYSQSTQYLSFKGDFMHTIQEKNFTLRPVGKSTVALRPAMLRGNSFKITLRSLSAKEAEVVHRNTCRIIDHGFPNYFDDQRFGSARHGHGFIAKKMILEHYQGALKLLLCYAHKEDTAPERRFKAYCLSHWRDWEGCLKMAPPFYRPILNYLNKNPKDFRNALKKIDRELLNLYLLAYQSYIFNEVLARLIIQLGQDNVAVRYSMGEFVFYRELRSSQSLRTMSIPMVNHKTKPSVPVRRHIEKVLAKEGINQKGMALQKMRLRGVRFMSFTRDAVVFPEALEVSDPESDEIYPNKSRCTVKCTLPRGTYATILIKSLFL